MKTLFNLILAVALAVFAYKIFVEGPGSGPAGDPPGGEGLTIFSGQAIQEGRPLLLEFWATWCPPCRQTIPHLNQLHTQFARKGLHIVGVTNENAATVQNFVRATPMHYTVALDPQNEYGRRYKIRSIPRAILFDARGKVVWDGHPAALDAATIQQVL